MIAKRGLHLNGSHYQGVHLNGYGALQLNGYGGAYGLPEDSWKQELSLPRSEGKGILAQGMMVAGVLYEIAKTYPLATLGVVGVGVLAVSPSARMKSMAMVDDIFSSEGAASAGSKAKAAYYSGRSS